MVTKLQRSPRKSELHAAVSLAHDVRRGVQMTVAYWRTVQMNSIYLFLIYL